MVKKSPDYYKRLAFGYSLASGKAKTKAQARALLVKSRKAWTQYLKAKRKSIMRR